MLQILAKYTEFYALSEIICGSSDIIAVNIFLLCFSVFSEMKIVCTNYCLYGGGGRERGVM